MLILGVFPGYRQPSSSTGWGSSQVLELHTATHSLDASEACKAICNGHGGKEAKEAERGLWLQDPGPLPPCSS
jgi:hypothetical protein